MTEAVWLACTDSEVMLRVLGGRSNHRKLRLFAVACCRRTLARSVGAPLVHALAVAERLADGQAVDALRSNALNSLSRVPYRNTSVAATLLKAPREAAVRSAQSAACVAADEVAWREEDLAKRQVVRRAEIQKERAAQSELLREIFGNPFRPVALSPASLTATVVALAAGIYDERAFDRLPILADALEDAGCTSAAILDHCRGPGPHVHGCWVVDLILGKQ
jgi:hypothetical protein